MLKVAPQTLYPDLKFHINDDIIGANYLYQAGVTHVGMHQM